MKNKPKMLNGGQKKTVFGGPRVRKARKTFGKVRINFLTGILVPFIKKKVKIKNVTWTKDTVRIRRDKEKKVPIHG